MPDNISKAIPQSLVKDLVLGNGLAKVPSALQALKEQFDYDYFNPPATVALETYLAILDYVRQTRFPDKLVDEGYFLIGTASLDGHFQGSVGKINKIAARMFSIEKAADLYIKTQRYNYPFGQHQMEEIRRGYIRYRRINVPTPPAFTEGVLTYLLQLSGGKTVKISSQQLSPEEVVYEARWEY